MIVVFPFPGRKSANVNSSSSTKKNRRPTGWLLCVSFSALVVDVGVVVRVYVDLIVTLSVRICLGEGLVVGGASSPSSSAWSSASSSAAPGSGAAGACSSTGAFSTNPPGRALSRDHRHHVVAFRDHSPPSCSDCGPCPSSSLSPWSRRTRPAPPSSRGSSPSHRTRGRPS